MIKRRIIFALAAAALVFAAAAERSAAQTGGDVVIVLPFENTSNLKEYNWVGESFADSMAELLNVPGLVVVSGDEREMVYQQMRLPQTVLPSRATAIKIGREARATIVVLGTYKVTPALDETTVARVDGTARVIRVNEGRLSGAQTPEGWRSRTYVFGDALVNLQTMQGKLAFEVLYERDKALPVAQNEILQKATKVPPKAFESYVKGKMTNDPDKKPNYLVNSMREYARANAGAVYTQAAFELGHLFYEREEWQKAAEHFSMLQKKDSHYAEAAFYAALSYWRMNDTVRALGALLPLSSDVPLTSIFNNAGSVSAQAARGEKPGEERDRLLKQAVTFLGRASESNPDDHHVRYNYAYALFLSGKYAEAVDQFREVIKKNPRDGEALFLFAKALERTNQPEAAAVNDNEARKHFHNYAKAQVEWQKSQSVPGVALRMRMEFNRFDYIAELRARTEQEKELARGANTQDLLAKARELYTGGRDDEALPELRRVVMIEPMNAEAYLLTGRIYMRRGELDAAINQLKTSIFWDSKLIDAHILLGRIFLERGDRTMAMSYARSAMQIDPNNQEAIALQRQVELGAR